MECFAYAQAGAGLPTAASARTHGIEIILLSDVIADLKKSEKEFPTVLRAAGGESLFDLMDSGESLT